MYDVVDVIRRRKSTPNSTEVRPNSTTLPSQIEPNNSAEVRQNRTSAHLYWATIKSYTISLLESSSGDIPSCS